MIRFFAPAFMALALMTTAAPAGALDITAMDDAERAAFRAEVRAYLMENPEVIIEAVNVLEQRQAEAAAASDRVMVMQNADALFDDGFSWVGGNPDGDVTLVEFMDYRCAYCRKAVPEVDALLESDGNIRLIIKELPILGEDSLISSRFAISARHVAGQDAYKKVHDALIAYTGDLSEVALRRLAEGLGLDGDAIIAGMDSDDVSHEIARTRALAQQMNISGTPSFVLDTEMLRGFVPAAQMAMIVKDIRDAR